MAKEGYLTRQAFMDRLERYGADLSLWPVEQVKLALALIETDTLACSAFAQAEKLDHLLRAAPAPEPDALRMEHAVMARLQRGLRQDPAASDGMAYGIVLAMRQHLGMAAGGLMMMGLIGFLAGMPSHAGLASASADPFSIAAMDATGDADIDTGRLF